MLGKQRDKKLKGKSDSRLALFSFIDSEALQPHVEEKSRDLPKLVKNNENFDVRAYMDSLVDENTGIIRDLKIDDRDFPSAKNFFDYSTTIIGNDANPPWIAQMWMCVFALGEVCPICSSKKWSNFRYIIEEVGKHVPAEALKEHLVFLEYGICPKCKTHKWELIKNHGLKNYAELVAVFGQRSGKSSSLALMSTYITHRYLKLPPLGTLTKAIQRSTPITSTFVSLNFAKAYKLLWTPYLRILQDSKWWNDYHEFLKYTSNRLGVELIKDKDVFLKYLHRNMELYPAGPKGETLRGETRFQASIDELALFPQPAGDSEEDEDTDRANADKTHTSLSTSLSTIQGVHLELLKRHIDIPPALMCGISSPMAERDKVWRLFQDSQTIEGSKTILGVNAATWEINPNMDRETSPMIINAFRRNSVNAMRDYGAVPPKVNSPFLSPTNFPYKLWTQPPTHELIPMLDEPGVTYAKVRKLNNVSFPSVLCLDAGRTNNSFAVVAGHFDLHAQKVVVTTLLEIKPVEGRPIDFNLVYKNVILPIAKDVHATACFADQWQGVELLDRLKDDMGKYGNGKPKCGVRTYSPKRFDFDTLTSLLTNSNIRLPFIKKEVYDETIQSLHNIKVETAFPSQHLLLQMLTIRDVGDTRCPEKGVGYTDDLYRALVLLTRIFDEKVMERLKTIKVESTSNEQLTVKPIYVSRGGL